MMFLIQIIPFTYQMAWTDHQRRGQGERVKEQAVLSFWNVCIQMLLTTVLNNKHPDKNDF